MFQHFLSPEVIWSTSVVPLKSRPTTQKKNKQQLHLPLIMVRVFEKVTHFGHHFHYFIASLPQMELDLRDVNKGTEHPQAKLQNN